MKMKRSCGILMPVSALPSAHGIGTLGRAAYEFVDFLARAGQSWWQLLPVGPTSYGDSPYQSFSAYAGNPYYIDLDMLVEDGLLTQAETCGIDWGDDAGRVDYAKLYENRSGVLRLAAERGIARDKAKLEAFAEQNGGWLGDYALFMALKDANGGKAWTEWEDARLRRHESEALRAAAEELRDDVQFYEYIQLLFFEQWEKLRGYAAKKGIGFIGDMPIYVALDSADVWSSPESFLLDEDNMPTGVAGVPPDYFSEDGQLWGNPLYDWDAMRADGYGWWIRRVDGAARLYDVLRIDHFRGFESYWAIPSGAKSAKQGCWVKGPGMDLVGRLTSWFSDMQFIAEDLGILTPAVEQLLSDSGLPGMKVLEFAFDPKEKSAYLPHRHVENCVCYLGTHDNPPMAAWLDEASREEKDFAARYLGADGDASLPEAMLRAGFASVARLFVAQLQDVLGLGAQARMNTPGTLGGNWRWRVDEAQLTDALAARLSELADMYERKNSLIK